MSTNGAGPVESEHQDERAVLDATDEGSTICRPEGTERHSGRVIRYPTATDGRR